MVFLSLEVLRVRPGRRGHSLGGGTFSAKPRSGMAQGSGLHNPPPRAPSAVRSGSGAPRAAFSLQCANCRARSVPTPRPLGRGGRRPPGELGVGGGMGEGSACGPAAPALVPWRLTSPSWGAASRARGRRSPAPTMLAPAPRCCLLLFLKQFWGFQPSENGQRNSPELKSIHAETCGLGWFLFFSFFFCHCWSVKGAVRLEAPLPGSPAESAEPSLREGCWTPHPPQPAPAARPARVAPRNLLQVQGGLSWCRLEPDKLWDSAGHGETLVPFHLQ